MIVKGFLYIPLAPLKGGIGYRWTIMLVISILRLNFHHPAWYHSVTPPLRGAGGMWQWRVDNELLTTFIDVYISSSLTIDSY